MKNIALFASGRGTNADNIIQYFKKNKTANIGLVITNNKNAGVLEVAKYHEVPSAIFPKREFFARHKILETLSHYNIDFIVLAGFMILIPKYLIDTFSGRIINIHPALLPAFGGKGMYGSHVHQAVYDSKVSQTGITIHHVNEFYDEGAVIFQASCSVEKTDTPESIAHKVHQLEYAHYPKVIENLVKSI